MNRILRKVSPTAGANFASTDKTSPAVSPTSRHSIKNFYHIYYDKREVSPKLAALALASVVLFVFTVLSDLGVSWTGIIGGGGDGEGSAVVHPNAEEGGIGAALYESLHPNFNSAHGASEHTTRNVPNAFLFPWQWGLRAAEGSGGNEDSEVFMNVGQGSPQPLAEEAYIVGMLSDYKSPSGLVGGGGVVSGEGAAASGGAEEAPGPRFRHTERTLDRLRARYYDNTDLLSAYQKVMSNQRRVGEEFDAKMQKERRDDGLHHNDAGNKRSAFAKPIQVMRSREDELPMPYAWGA